MKILKSGHADDQLRVLPMLCGRTPTGDPVYFPQSEYRGRKIYFCTDVCLREFLLDPDGFHRAHHRWQHKSTLETSQNERKE